MASNKTSSVFPPQDPEKKFDCVWYKEDFYSTVAAKQAISAAIFILFLAYTVFVFLRHKNKESGLGVKFHRIVNELAYTHLFFFIGAILCHVLTPKDFPVLLIYVYVTTLIGDVFATL